MSNVGNSQNRPLNTAANHDWTGNNDWSGEIAYTGIISPTSLSTNQDDYNPTNLAGSNVIRQAISAGVEITGLQGGVSGRTIYLFNISTSFAITLKHQSGSSSPANRFFTPDSVDAVIPKNGAAVIQYDVTTGWRIVGITQTLPTGALINQGGYNAATNTPDLDVAPSASIQNGWTYITTVAGTFFTQPLDVGDMLIASTDAPTALSDWVIVERNLDGAVTAAAAIPDGEIVEGDGGAEGVRGSGVATSVVTANQKRTYQTGSTGLIDGCDISINGGGTTVNIDPGEGVVCDSFTDPTNPICTDHTFSGVTGLVLTNIATTIVTFLGLDDSSNTVTQQSTPFTDEQRRDFWWIGFASHLDNINVGTIGLGVNSVTDQNNSLRDLWAAIGTVTIGSDYAANGANLNIDRAAGTKSFTDINYAVARKTPNIRTMPSATTEVFSTMRRDGSGGFVTTTGNTVVDVGNIDLGNASLDALGTNKYQIMRIYYFAENSTTLTYGQVPYNSFDEAVAGIATELPVLNPLLLDVNLKCFLVVRGGGSDLSDATEVLFSNTGKFGNLGGGGAGGGGGGSQDYQSVYNISVTPQVTTSVAGGAVVTRRGSTLDTDKIKAGQNGAGTETSAITGEGVSTQSGRAGLSKGADVASATALPLLQDGNYFDVTGTTTITSFATVGVGTFITLHFDGILTLTHNATDLILPGAANVTTAAGDEFTFFEYASGDYRCVSYALASGESIVAGGSGDVTASANMTDHSLVRGDGGAKGVQDSGVLIDDSDNITAVNDFTTVGNIDAGGHIEISGTGGFTLGSVGSVNRIDYSGGFRFINSSSLFEDIAVGGIALSATLNIISAATSDASDNAANYYCGGGSNDPSRGSFITTYGNEHAGAGALQHHAGTGSSGMQQFFTDSTLRMSIAKAGAVDVVGALSKGSGTFKIDHPLDPENKDLYHGFVEAPRYDLIYRGRAKLVDGKATVSIDLTSNMTRGTFAKLTQNVQVTSLQNNETFDRVIGSVRGGMLTIESENVESTATIDWVVIGERADAFVKSHEANDSKGRLLVEVDKEDLDIKELEAREIEAKEAAEDTQEEVMIAAGKKGYVRHREAYPDCKPLPRRTVRTIVKAKPESPDVTE